MGLTFDRFEGAGELLTFFFVERAGKLFVVFETSC